MIISFYLRTLRICSPQYRHSEQKYIENTCKKKFTVLGLRRKLTESAKTENINKPDKTRHIIRHRAITTLFENNSSSLIIKCFTITSKTVRDLINTKYNKNGIKSNEEIRKCILKK